MLAEYSVSQFNAVIPLFYRFLPTIMVGNLDMLKLSILMLLPDTVSNLILSIKTWLIKWYDIDWQPYFEPSLWWRQDFRREIRCKYYIWILFSPNLWNNMFMATTCCWAARKGRGCSVFFQEYSNDWFLQNKL